MTSIEERTLEVAEEVAETLAAHAVPTAVIGAIAAAVHGYARMTRDVDLATDADPLITLPAVVRDLVARGYEVTLASPDADDPPGGVVTVRGEGFDPIRRQKGKRA